MIANRIGPNVAFGNQSSASIRNPSASVAPDQNSNEIDITGVSSSLVDVDQSFDKRRVIVWAGANPDGGYISQSSEENLKQAISISKSSAIEDQIKVLRRDLNALSGTLKEVRHQAGMQALQLGAYQRIFRKLYDGFKNAVDVTSQAVDQVSIVPNLEV